MKQLKPGMQCLVLPRGLGRPLGWKIVELIHFYGFGSTPLLTGGFETRSDWWNVSHPEIKSPSHGGTWSVGEQFLIPLDGDPDKVEQEEREKVHE